MFYCQICCIQKSTLNVDISTKKLHKLQEVPGKVTFMTTFISQLRLGVADNGSSEAALLLN